MDKLSITSPKRCPKCEREYPRTAEYFYRRHTQWDGLACYCKACDKAIRDSKKQHREPIEDASKSHRCYACGESYPRTTEYFCRNRSKPDGMGDECRICNRRLCKAYIAKYPDRYKARNKIQYQRQKTRAVEYNRIYCKNNRDRVLEYHRKSRLKHRETGRAAVTRRAARVKGAEGNHTGDDIKRQVASQTDRKGRIICWWCNKPIVGAYHCDHWMPLSRGGSNDARNIVISCPECNMKKGAKMPHSWSDRLI